MTPIERTLAARGETVVLQFAGGVELVRRGMVERRRESVPADDGVEQRDPLRLTLAGTDAMNLSIGDRVRVDQTWYDVGAANGVNGIATEFDLDVSA